MKQGSADDPFAEDPEEKSEEPNEEPTDEVAAGTASSGDGTAPAQKTSARPSPQRQSLPYIHSRDGVKDGRTQRPIFLRDHVEDGVDDLVDQMEDELGETVYKTDVTEAAMLVAQENPELVLSTLEEWGYGWS